jgi:hypothetical protein
VCVSERERERASRQADRHKQARKVGKVRSVQGRRAAEDWVIERWVSAVWKD